MGPAATYAIRDGGIPIYPEYKGIKCVCVKLKKNFLTTSCNIQDLKLPVVVAVVQSLSCVSLRPHGLQHTQLP